MGKQPQSVVKLTCFNHAKLLLDGMWVKYEQREVTDLYIEVNADPCIDTLQVHALPLSIIAPHFLQKFSNYRCAINFDRNTMASILEFIYRGHVDVCRDNLEELLKAAQALGIDLLSNAISELRENLNREEIPRQIVTRNSNKKLYAKQPLPPATSKGRNKRNKSAKKSSSSEEDSENSEGGFTDFDSEKDGDEDYNYEEDMSSINNNNADSECRVVDYFSKNKPSEVVKKSGMTIKCPLCDFETDTQKAYSKHLTIKHRLDAKKNRVQIHFKCSECSYLSTSKEQLNDHKKNEHGQRKFQCSECEFFTDKKKLFDRHVNCYHSVDRPFKCHSCDYTARTLKLLTSHKKIHSGETFECKVCSRSFTTKCYLDRHTKLHTNTEKKFSCQFCTHKSRSRHDMDKHLKTLHSFVRPKPLESKPKSEIPIGGYKCTHCQYKTRYRTCWVDHLASKHKVDPDGNTVTPSIRCKLCDFTCLVQYQLYTHMAKVHLEKRFKCQQCAYSSFRKADITLHVQSKHGTERPYMCETCGFRSKTQCDIRRHTLTHTIGKRFVCEFCNKFFAFKYYLTKHLLRCHPKNEKPLKCCLCSYTTKTPPYLIGHTKRMHKEVEDPENAIQRAVVIEGCGIIEGGMDVYEPIPNLEQALASCQQQLVSFH